MNSERRTAIILGFLLISGIVSGILSSVPALEYPDYLATLSAIGTRVITAIFFQAAMAIAYVWIAALFYQIIKKYSEVLAIAYFGLRIIGAAFLFSGIASLSLLLSLSRDFASAGFPDVSYFQAAGELLRMGRDLLNHVGMILPWVTGGLILCLCMYKMRLVPPCYSRFLYFRMSEAVDCMTVDDPYRLQECIHDSRADEGHPPLFQIRRDSV